MIPESFIQDLLNRVDIVDVIDKSVPLKKAGANYSARCPFHNEKSPSFTVSPTKQFYHCFGCGAHGSAIGFLMEYAGLSFVESVHDLAKGIGMIVPEEKRDPDRPPQKVVVGLQESLEQASAFYKAELRKSERAIEYLKGRGLSGEIAKQFQIGYAPAGWQNLETVFPEYDSEALTSAGLVVTNDQGKRYDRFRDRIMFPIHNQKGQVIGFGGRVINPEDTPKYYNSPETPVFQKGQELYGLFTARRAIRDAGRVLVVEGYMDVVALAQYDIHYAVAALGTATTPVHITKLKRQTEEVVFCFDGDNAGKTAAWRAAMNALPALTDGLKLRYLFLPDGHDPDSYVREFGKEKFEMDITQAMPLSQYIIQHLSEQNPLQSQEDKVKFLNDAEPILQAIQAPRYALFLRKRVAELTQISEQEMQSMLKLTAPKKQRAKARSREMRVPLSIKKRFVLMVLMQPSLANQSHLNFANGQTSEDVLLKTVVEMALMYPSYKPSALLHAMESQLDAALLRELQRELLLIDDDEEQIALEFEGACTQLSEVVQVGDSEQVLNALKEKPLSALTDAEREQLRQLTVKK